MNNTLVSINLPEEIKLDKRHSKSAPLYEQIRQHIRRLIQSNSLKPSERLPTISNMARQLDVDFSTVKSAFELLADERLLEFESRRGIFIGSVFLCEM